MFGLVSSPIMYYIFKLKYGGLTANDAEKYPINKRTKLAPGDLYRIASTFGLFALLGFVGGYVFFPWYEGAWGAEYYAESYGNADAFALILDGIILTSYVFFGAALILTVLARKLEPKGLRIL